jgi:hypothetical protein
MRENKQRTNKCLPHFHFHRSPTLRPFQVALLLQTGVSVLLENLHRHGPAHPTVILTIPRNIVLAAETHAVPLASTRMYEQEANITVTTDDMTHELMSLTEGTTGETMTVTVHATTTMAATDVAMIVTATMKIMIAPATNVIATADSIRVMVHRVDVPGAVGEVSDHGHPGVVHLRVVLAPLLHHLVVAHRTRVPQVLV